jgi:hypothetical protein
MGDFRMFMNQRKFLNILLWGYWVMHIIFFFFDNELKLYVLRFNSVEGPVDLASLEKSRSYESSRDYIGEMWGFEKQQEE